MADEPGITGPKPPLDGWKEQATFVPGKGSGATAVGAVRMPAPENLGAILEPGTVLSGRYEISQMLGLGGMGAVYQAHDRELDRIVALKVIRPDLAQDPDIVRRFKQEMVLARQITHRNVVRVYDVGESDGIKFVTMEFVVGRNLRSELDEYGKFTVEEAINVMRQMCRGLYAAHEQGVIHRDLKPGNLMRDPKGRIVVMDFGLARDVSSSGHSETGMMVGTVQYMSPEQARGAKIDARSDLYTVGLMVYEMIAGELPFRAENPVASLLKRNTEAATPLINLVPSVPPSLSAIVAKCLELDPNKRYQAAQEILDDLDRAFGRPNFGSDVGPAIEISRPKSKRTQIGIAAAVVAVLMVTASLIYWNKFKAPAAQPATVTVLLADFANTTGEEVFDGTLEPAFGLALEGASFVNSYNRGQARRIAGQLQPGTTGLTDAAARLVAVREGVGVVVTGSIAKNNDSYKIATKAVDAASGKVLAELSADSGKQEVLKNVGTLAAKLRSALGDSAAESVATLQAESYTSNSLEAAQAYAKAQEARSIGQAELAIANFRKAIELDKDFGSAYAGLAAMYANTGQRTLALETYNTANAVGHRMTEREKLRTRGAYYLAALEPKKAIDEFTALVQKYPADSMGHSSLAFAYYLARDYVRAEQEGRKALAIYPKNVPYRNNVALYAIYNGDFDGARREALAAMEMNPGYLKAYISVALTAIAKGEPDLARETYKKLAAVSSTGKSFAATGEADLLLYEGRFDAAKAALLPAVEEDSKAGNSAGAAKKLAMLAEIEFALGNRAQALTLLNRATAMNKNSVLFQAGRLYAAAGDATRAKALALELSKQFETIPQAYGKLIEGGIELQAGRTREAIRLFQESLRLSDSWIGHFELGRAYLGLGAYTEADTELSLCFRRRGEATDIFLDEQQTFRFYPAVLYYQARGQEAMKSPGKDKAYEAFLALKASYATEPLVLDARKRLSSVR